MDLLTALALTEPELDSPHKIRADFATLTQLPAPERQQHPAYTEDSFSSISDAPVVITTSTAAEIRRHAQSIDAEKVSPERSRNRASFNDMARIYVNAIPIPKRKSDAIPVTPSSTTTSSPPAKPANGSVRKFSDILKSKRSILNITQKERSISECVYNRDDERKFEEKRLRNSTACMSYDYNQQGRYPKHPLTSRDWHARNLKCTVCPDYSCGICSRACCAYKMAVVGRSHHAGAELERLEDIIARIAKLHPYGKELPTFMQCTSQDGSYRSESIAGCGRWVCPDCCSQCPDNLCKDVQCRRCKPDMWTVCDWHEEY